jgi:hypothetical protein
VIIIKDSPEHFLAGSRKITGEALLFKPAGDTLQLRFQAAWGIFSSSNA